jgi:hypothetical protein
LSAEASAIKPGNLVTIAIKHGKAHLPLCPQEGVDKHTMEKKCSPPQCITAAKLSIAIEAGQ